MSTLAKKGLVEKRGNRLVLRNLPALEMLAGQED
jgi:hypothetical protein